MRSDKDVSREALRRAAVICERRALKKRRLYTACSVAVCFALIIGLSIVLSTVNTETVTPEGIHGAALFADGEAGGYVMIGIIGFVLGVAVTLFCARKLKKD